jgi:hypothetical protein
MMKSFWLILLALSFNVHSQQSCQDPEEHFINAQMCWDAMPEVSAIYGFEQNGNGGVNFETQFTADTNSCEQYMQGRCSEMARLVFDVQQFDILSFPEGNGITLDIFQNDEGKCECNCPALSCGHPLDDQNSPTPPGMGAERNPYRVYNPQALVTIANNPMYADKFIDLCADVVLEYGPQFEYFQMNYSFSGTFDGNGFSISNLEIKNNSPLASNINFSEPIGLFKSIGGGSVNDLRLLNAVIDASGSNSVGILAGSTDGANLTNITIQGSLIGGDYTGFISGHANTTTAKRISLNGSSTGSSYSGGAFGHLLGTIADRSRLEKVTSEVSVNSVGTSNYVGGLIGLSEYSDIHEANVVTENIIALSGGKGVGGVIGEASYTLLTGYTIKTGEIIGGSRTGGVIGEMSGNTITEFGFYQGVSVIATDGGDHGYAGGLVGKSTGSSNYLRHSFADGGTVQYAPPPSFNQDIYLGLVLGHGNIMSENVWRKNTMNIPPPVVPGTNYVINPLGNIFDPSAQGYPVGGFGNSNASWSMNNTSPQWSSTLPVLLGTGSGECEDQ